MFVYCKSCLCILKIWSNILQHLPQTSGDVTELAAASCESRPSAWSKTSLVMMKFRWSWSNMANSPKLSHLKEGKHIQKSYVNGKWWDSQDSLVWPWVSLKMRYIVYPQVPNLWQLEREEHDDKAWTFGVTLITQTHVGKVNPGWRNFLLFLSYQHMGHPENPPLPRKMCKFSKDEAVLDRSQFIN